jgi:hypothetical protein
MSNSENDRLAHELGMAWDDLVSGETVTGLKQESALLSTVLLIEQMDRNPGMSIELQEATWAKVIAGTVKTLSPATNPPPAPVRHPVLEQCAPLLRWAQIVVTGMIGGFIAGIGSRIFMRLSGFLTVDQNRFRLTEKEARVGEITVRGTMVLGVIGAGAGVLSLLLYLFIRDRLPFEGWRKSSAYAVLLLVVFGYVVMDPSNPDYHLFGPAWLNISTFSSLYLLMGFCTAQVYELSRGLNRRFNLASRPPAIQFTLLLISVPVSVLGFLITLTALFLGTTGLIVVAIGGLAWILDRLMRQGHVSLNWMPGAVRPWGVLVVPGILGFILTARGIAEILVNR